MNTRPKTSNYMKRIDNLFTKICQLDNLFLADQKARKGKQNTYGVKLYDKNSYNNIIKLRELLITGKYKTSKYTIFKIYEPKEREIFRLPYYPDRIVHHAIMNIMEPIWVNIFIHNTYSYIKKRGIHKAVNDIKTDLRKDPIGTKCCLKFDIKHYYPSIDHDVLKTIIRKKIKDARLLNLLDEIINSASGVPIGNYLSQFFANLYLAYFDHWAKEALKIKYYYRYCDDIVILADSKQKLHEWFNEINKYLTERLKLTIKQNWQIYKIDVRGIDFVGYVFRHGFTKLRKSIKKNLCRKVILQSRMYKDTLTRSIKVGSYFGWLNYCNSSKLKTKLNNSYYHEEIFRIQRSSRNVHKIRRHTYPN